MGTEMPLTPEQQRNAAIKLLTQAAEAVGGGGFDAALVLAMALGAALADGAWPMDVSLHTQQSIGLVLHANIGSRRTWRGEMEKASCAGRA